MELILNNFLKTMLSLQFLLFTHLPFHKDLRIFSSIISFRKGHSRLLFVPPPSPPPAIVRWHRHAATQREDILRESVRKVLRYWRAGAD
jgi:hypothetical protein